MVKIYYGMSGSLKYTKIQSEKNPGDTCILSSIKPHLKLASELLSETPRDIDFAMQRLLQYQDLQNLNPQGDILVERGISDFLESWISQPGHECYNTREFIQPWLDKETELLSKYGPVYRELLVMKDLIFVDEEVLSEPSRHRRFPDTDVYFKRQDDYADFTLGWNDFDNVVVIEDAYDFIRELKNKS